LILIIKNKNHFISLLLILEIFSLRRIFIVRFISQLANSSIIIFVLITLRVGEAVLGLAILVKLIR
jgi:NADH:ubiquinone oxidoreductase subunit K